MPAAIELLTGELARVDNARWQSETEPLTEMLQAVSDALLENEPTAQWPDLDSTLARKVIELLGGTVVEENESPPVEAGVLQ